MIPAVGSETSHLVHRYLQIKSNMSLEYDSPSSLSRHVSMSKESLRARKSEKKRKREAAQKDTKTKKRNLVKSSKTTNKGPHLSHESSHSPFTVQKSSLYLSLSPIAQNRPLQGLCAEHLSPLILTYYPPLRGVVLSYNNAQLSNAPQQTTTSNHEVYAETIDEYAASHVWITADFLLFRPQKGCLIEGWINLQNEGNIGLVCWNFFNATIAKNRLPRDWKWVSGGLNVRSSKKKLKGSERSDRSDVPHGESNSQLNGLSEVEGYFGDGKGTRIQGLLQFTVKDVDTSRSTGGDNNFLSIEGTLLDEDEERNRRVEGGEEFLRREKKRRKRLQEVEFSSGLGNRDND